MSTGHSKLSGQNRSLHTLTEKQKIYYNTIFINKLILYMKSVFVLILGCPFKSDEPDITYINHLELHTI